MDSFSGIWPVAPTPFNADGSLDQDGMRRVIDCLIDQGSDAICILANYSEQFVLSDDERALVTRLCLEHVAGRVPIVVTISHFATQIAVERARFAKEHGAAAVMMMPPYHGATLRAGERAIFEQFERVGEVGLPIMIQDALMSGTELSNALLVKMAREIEMVKLFKIECARAADKLRGLLAEGGPMIEGPFDGEEGITLLADLQAGARGTMTSGMIVDKIKPVVTAFAAGDRTGAAALYAEVLPAINHENRQCGWRACKAAMLEGKVIRSDASRHPVEPLGEHARDELMRLLRPLDPIVLGWGS